MYEKKKKEERTEVEQWTVKKKRIINEVRETLNH